MTKREEVFPAHAGMIRAYHSVGDPVPKCGSFYAGQS